jgi:protein required for attachment to host cells
MARYPTTWVVVADSARARFFEWREPTEPLCEIADLANPEGRIKEKDLGSDRAGVASNSQGYNGGHPMQATSSGHDKSEIEFADRIDDVLTEALDAAKFEQVMVYAPPHFLGNLRTHFSARVAKVVIQSEALNLTREDASLIRSRLPALKAVL